MRWRPQLAAGFAAMAGVLAPASAAGPPSEVVSFSRGIPAYFARLGDYISRETMSQTRFNPETGQVLRHRVIVSDLQISHLGQDPNALWEFRFVRRVDRLRIDVDSEIRDFFKLRQPDAGAERLALARVAMNWSLLGCYWHNLTLSLLAFQEPLLGNYEWSGSGRRFRFRQVRGPGIPVHYFDPDSARSYPEGTIELSPDGSWLESLELVYPVNSQKSIVRLEFSRPAAPGEIALPKHFEAEGQRLESGLRLLKTDFDYSEFRRFSVSAAPAVASDPR
jgi:hypothetical protein